MLHPPIVMLELYLLEFDGLIRLIHQELINNRFDRSARSMIILEYFSQKAGRQQSAWRKRKSNKKYKVNFPASLALALYEWLDPNRIQVTPFQQAFIDKLDQELIDLNLVERRKKLN